MVKRPLLMMTVNQTDGRQSSLLTMIVNGGQSSLLMTTVNPHRWWKGFPVDDASQPTQTVERVPVDDAGQPTQTVDRVPVDDASQSTQTVERVPC